MRPLEKARLWVCPKLELEPEFRSERGPESIQPGLGVYNTDVGCVIKSDVNLGLGSPPRNQNSISDRDVLGVVSPILGKVTRTEVETPPSKSTLALPPLSSFFIQIDGGDSFNGGTRPVSKDRVRVSDPLRTVSRYLTI